MYNIKVYFLENCKNCKKIKELFDDSGYIVSYFDSETSEETCDFLETITGDFVYPMVHIISPEKINYILNISKNYNPLNSFIFLDLNNWIHCRCISVEDIFNNVKKIINE